MRRKLQLSHFSAGLTAVVVGYSSSVVLVIEAAKAAGADADTVISWLLVLGLGMGITCVAYSLRYRVPVVTAWSTPGAAFLIGAVGGYSINEIIGAFVTAGVFALIAAQSRSLSKIIERIPAAISSAMLAGILLPICLGIFTDAASHPALVVGFLLIYLVGSFWFPRYLMLILLLLAVSVGLLVGDFAQNDISLSIPKLVWVTPSFSLSATVSLAIPLFLITMLSQNLPGIAILKSYDYSPSLKPVLSGLGILQILTAPFGGFAYNLAAITAALCMGDNAGEERDQRYLAAVVAGIGYILFGLFAPMVVYMFSQMAPVIVHLLAGLALLATLQAALLRSMDNHEHRHAALLTLLCSASGITLAKLSAPVWGLLLGLLVLAAGKAKQSFLVKE